MIFMVFIGILYYFWRDLAKREQAELVQLQQRKEALAKREAEYARVRQEVRSLPKPRTRSLPRTPQPTVATPRQAAPSPTHGVVKRPSYTPSPQPAAPAATQDTIGDALIGAAAGYAIGSLISSVLDNDRPSQPASNQCTANDTPFASGGGGDFGGGGADSSWDSSSSSSPSDNNF